MSLLGLDPPSLALLSDARRAVLATIRPDGRARLVPITYAFDRAAGVLYSALDDKRKAVDDPRGLARVRDIAARPAVSVLVDRWSEDWSELGWLRLDGHASLLDPREATHAAEHADAVRRLHERYGQYADHRLEMAPVLRIEIEHVTGWAA